MNLFLNKISRFAWPKIQKISHDTNDAFFCERCWQLLRTTGVTVMID